ncbi:MAG: GNAT family N-acetyltransferase [Pseudomonadota bacterium]
MTSLTVARVDPLDPAAIACLERYYAELAAILETGFDVNLSNDPNADDMRPPRGRFFVATHDGRPVGCVGLKGGTDYAEIKRLWVDPDTRGLGIARKLMEATEADARTIGIRCLRLDTNTALPAAIAMYRKWNWTEIAPFNDDPYAQVFFEKLLPAQP